MKVVPLPHLACAPRACRPSARTRVIATSTPTPRPDTPLTACRGAEARPREHPQQLVVGRAPRPPASDQRPRAAPWPGSPPGRCRARRRSPGASRCSARARPTAGSGPRPACRPRPAPSGGLDAVIDRVADQVQQRIADLVEDRAVELDLLALDVEPDPLAEVPRQVAHQPGEALEHLADRASSAPRSPPPASPTPAGRSGRSPRRARGRRRRAASTPSRFLATTSSPTCFISASSRPRSTRICRRRAPAVASAARPPRTGPTRTSPAVRSAAADLLVAGARCRSGRRAGRRSPRARAAPAAAGPRDTAPSASARRTARSGAGPAHHARRAGSPPAPSGRAARRSRRRRRRLGLAPAAARRRADRRAAGRGLRAPRQRSVQRPSGALPVPAAARSTAVAERVDRAEQQLEGARLRPRAAPGAAASSRFSIRCASSATPVKPIVAAMPLIVWIARNSPPTGSVAAGLALPLEQQLVAAAQVLPALGEEERGVLRDVHRSAQDALHGLEHAGGLERLHHEVLGARPGSPRPPAPAGPWRCTSGSWRRDRSCRSRAPPRCRPCRA